MQAKYRKQTTGIFLGRTLSCISPHVGTVAGAARNRMHRQQGASAIEFALVFPLFFLIIYAIITYGLIFVAQQSITLAAAEGARAALRHVENPVAEAREEERNTNAENAAIGNGSAATWLTTRIVFDGKPLPCPYDNAPNPVNCYRVTVTYPNYRDNPLVPLLLGPLMGFAVPTQLSSTAIVQLD